MLLSATPIDIVKCVTDIGKVVLTLAEHLVPHLFLKRFMMIFLGFLCRIAIKTDC